MDFKIEFKLSFFSWSYFFIISGFSSKHSNTYSSFYYQEYRLLEGTSLVAEGRVGEKEVVVGETVLNKIFKNGFISLKCTDYRDSFENFSDCTDFKKMYGFF